ncbi:MAG: hypothetical protein AAB372_03195 [Patescibacteria group bacterium]
MKKKIILALAATGTAVAMLPLFAAFEAHVINVTAKIENALSVPIEELEFGTVFPQEKLDKNFTISMSEAFLNALDEDAPAPQWATGVVSSAQGLRKNATAVLPDRSDANQALGPAESSGTPSDVPIPGTFFSLGFGGSVVLSFNEPIVNVGGGEVKDFEVTGGTYPDEKVMTEGSQDGINWVVLDPSGARDHEVDLGPLPWAKFVRITDVSDPNLFEDTADGYDLDAVQTIGRNRAGAVMYIIRQKPKCVDNQNASVHPQVKEDTEGNFYCPEGSTQMPLLCPYLSKHEITDDSADNQENDSAGISAFHGLPGSWNLATTIATQVWGKLVKPGVNDIADTWNIDLKVPCFAGQCAQDWPAFVHEFNPNADPEAYKADPALEHQVFGCDLWVEVSGIN